MADMQALLKKKRIEIEVTNSMIKDIESNFDIQSHIVKNPTSTYFMRVGSDAMIDSGIHPGDKLAVDKALPPKHKDIVVSVSNGQFLIRRLYALHGLIELRADNENCPSISYNSIEEVDIWGVVVGVVRKL